jgi:hypothetical protein
MSYDDTVRTSAFINLKQQTQDAFNFAYVVSQAVPCLKLQMSLIEKGVISKLGNPDYFKNPNDIDIIRQQVKNYKEELCKHVLLSSFSYFESYIIDVCNEFMNFHKGQQSFLEQANKKFMSTIVRQRPKHKLLKRILRRDKFKTKVFAASIELKKEGYVFPSRLFFNIGASAFVQQLGNLKSVRIPEFIEASFGYSWTDDQKSKFHEIRDIRNRIAHGKRVSLSLERVAGYNSFFREMALNIDKHLVDLFFICERHA